jgi:hypothetical protein
MAYENRKWVIMTLTDINSGDIKDDDDNVIGNTYIDNAIQTSKDTLRKSVDGTKAILKWDGAKPRPFYSMDTYDHSEILEILSGSEWTNPIE